MDFCINPVLAAIEQSENHQSILSVNENMRVRGWFKLAFHFITLQETIKEGALLSNKKGSQASGIFMHLHRSNCLLYIMHNFNNAASISEFPVSLKCADITPIFEKDDKINKTVIRP